MLSTSPLSIITETTFAGKGEKSHTLHDDEHKDCVTETPQLSYNPTR